MEKLISPKITNGFKDILDVMTLFEIQKPTIKSKNIGAQKLEPYESFIFINSFIFDSFPMRSITKRHKNKTRNIDFADDK